MLGINSGTSTTSPLTSSDARAACRRALPGKTVVSELRHLSGGAPEELDRVGVDAVLVGEALMPAGPRVGVPGADRRVSTGTSKKRGFIAV